jgi:hypothetical protein
MADSVAPWNMPVSAFQRRTASSSVPAAVPGPSSSIWPTANAKSITVVSRHPHSKTEFDAFTKKIGADTIDYQDFEHSQGGDVLVNCTPVGMFP